MSVVLVTGATGFLGSYLTSQLLRDGARVRILRRETSRLDLLGNATRQVEHVIGDVDDPISLVQAMRGARAVYHAAGYIGFGGARDRKKLHRINVAGTAHVVDAALEAGVDRLVYTSSMAALGRPEAPAGPIDESLTWQRSRYNTEYAHSKHLAELEVLRGVAEGLDAVIINPSLIFGVGRPSENTQEIVEKVRDRRLMAAPEGGTNVVDVRDVAAAHIKAMERGAPGERYFVGSENLSWREILSTVAVAFGVRPPRWTFSSAPAMALAAVSEAVAFVTRTRPFLTRETARTASATFVYDNSKAREHLGCTFRPFSETARWLADELA